MFVAKGSLPSRVQRAALATLTIVSRLGLSRRRRSLPEIGDQTHLTAVVRLGESVIPDLSARSRHYIYPKQTVHVTIANLDNASADLEVALGRLAKVRLSAPTFTIETIGSSPDTLFLRCVHDRRFDDLRRTVEEAFEVRTSPSPASLLFRRLSFANVVRFDGPGDWQQIPPMNRQVTCKTLEIVRTDKYLSPSGTTLIQQFPLESLDG